MLLTRIAPLWSIKWWTVEAVGSLAPKYSHDLQVKNDCSDARLYWRWCNSKVTFEKKTSFVGTFRKIQNMQKLIKHQNPTFIQTRTPQKSSLNAVLLNVCAFLFVLIVMFSLILSHWPWESLQLKLPPSWFLCGCKSDFQMVHMDTHKHTWWGYRVVSALWCSHPLICRLMKLVTVLIKGKVQWQRSMRT